VRRIKWYEHTPVEFWIYLVLLLVLLLILIPWLIKHSQPEHHHGRDAIVGVR
jgi:competence protein ComGC